MKKLFRIIPSIVLGATLLLSNGCRSTDPNTGHPVFDPVRTEKVTAAAQTLVTVSLRAVLANQSPGTRVKLGNYYRAVGSVFCQMEAEGKFSPDFLIGSLNNATAGLQSGLDQDVLAIKDGIIALYQGFYADRFNAELDPEKWPIFVARTMCASVNTALVDTGLPPVH